MPRAIIQMAYVTRDLESSVDFWVNSLGAGPFFFSDVYFPAGQIYRGAATAMQFRLATGFSGEMNIELVRQENADPSPFREVLDAAASVPVGGVFHHVQLAQQDYDAAYADLLAAGAERCFDATVPGIGRLAFIDARAVMGCHVELVEPNSLLPKARKAMREAHFAWNGDAPKRSLADLMRLVAP